MKQETEILDRREFNGIDCTEDESARLKMWIKDTMRAGCGDTKLLERIGKVFPLEYSEAFEELETNNQ
jgi:hypothetical protein